jgi:hypothetical protein
MSKPILAVGIDPAKRVHRAVGVLFPEEVVFDAESPYSGFDSTSPPPRAYAAPSMKLLWS